MNKNIHIWLCIGLAPAILVLAGCGPSITYDRTQYVLNPIRTAAPAPVASDAVLEVRRFMMDSAFQGKKLVYRTGEVAYETDFYHEFLGPPASMIREATRNWLAQSNLFARVVDTGVYLEPNYALEANVTMLYGDTRDPSAAKAVLELRAFLLNVEGSGDPQLVYSRVYSATRDAPTADPDGLVVGFDACLQAVLTDLERDIAAKLN